MFNFNLIFYKNYAYQDTNKGNFELSFHQGIMWWSTEAQMSIPCSDISFNSNHLNLKWYSQILCTTFCYSSSVIKAYLYFNKYSDFTYHIRRWGLISSAMTFPNGLCWPYIDNWNQKRNDSHLPRENKGCSASADLKILLFFPFRISSLWCNYHTTAGSYGKE